MATFKNTLDQIGNFAKQTFADASTSVISNMINNAFNRSMMKAQYELNEQAAQNAYNRQLDFWNKQNDYNDPSSQMVRLRQAGLNPAIMNGNINNTAGNLSSVSSSSVSGQSSNRTMDRVDLLQLVSQNLQNQNLEANTQYIVQQTNRERMNNIKLAIETDDFASWYYYQKQLLIETVGEKRANRILTEHKARTEFENARQLWLNNNFVEDAASTGVNPVIDAHNESSARVAKLYNDISTDNSRLDLDWSRYLTDKQLTLETIKQLSRNNQLADQVMTNYNIDYNSLPDYLKTMLSGIILLEKKASTTMFDSVGDKKKYNDYINQLKTDFATYYSAYLKNSSDITASQAGNHLTMQNIISALALLK